MSEFYNVIFENPISPFDVYQVPSQLIRNIEDRLDALDMSELHDSRGNKIRQTDKFDDVGIYPSEETKAKYMFPGTGVLFTNDSYNTAVLVPYFTNDTTLISQYILYPYPHTDTERFNLYRDILTVLIGGARSILYSWTVDVRYGTAISTTVTTTIQEYSYMQDEKRFVFGEAKVQGPITKRRGYLSKEF